MQPLEIDAVALAGAWPLDFTVDTTGPFSLAGLQSKAITVGFAPLYTGQYRQYTAEVDVSVSGLATQKVMLSGIADPPLADMTMRPADLAMPVAPAPRGCGCTVGDRARGDFPSLALVALVLALRLRPRDLRRRR